MPFRIAEPRMAGLWNGAPLATSKTRMRMATAAAPMRPAMIPSRTMRLSAAMRRRLRRGEGGLAVLARLGSGPPEEHHRPRDQVAERPAHPHEDPGQLLIRPGGERPRRAGRGIERVEQVLGEGD